MSTKGEHINALPHGTGVTSAFKTYTAESRATGRTHTLISKASVHAAVQRSRALGDVTPMTQDDLWDRVAKDASAKPYKALALDLGGKAHRRHDQAVETGLSSHNRVEKAQARQDAASQMKAAYEIGLAREAFAQQRGALETLADAAFERLKQAADLIAERENRRGGDPTPADAVGSAEPQAPEVHHLHLLTVPACKHNRAERPPSSRFGHSARRHERGKSANTGRNAGPSAVRCSTHAPTPNFPRDL